MFALFLFLLWGFACAMFDASLGNRWVGRSVIDAGIAFVSNAFEYLPQMPQVVKYIFAERLWFVFVSTAVLGLGALFAVMLVRVQRSFDEPKRGARFSNRK